MYPATSSLAEVQAEKALSDDSDNIRFPSFDEVAVEEAHSDDSATFITLDEIEGEPVLVTEDEPVMFKRVVKFDMRHIEELTKSGIKSDADIIQSLAPSTGVAEWFKAAESGMADGQYLVGMCLREGVMRERDVAASVKWFRLAADQGHPRAQSALGDAYGCGQGVASNATEAVFWYRKAAVQGYSVAQAKLGEHYFGGIGVRESRGEAARWWEKAAEQGLAEASHYLGWCYVFGYGVEQEPTTGMWWIREAAEIGDLGAQLYLAHMASFYDDETNRVFRVHWLKKAAKQGHVEASHELGLCYFDGIGVKQDRHAAARLFRVAADKGIAEAQRMLGVCYAEGHGVRKDPVSAVSWFRKAAEQGDAGAHANLGVSYLTGSGVVQDDVQCCVHWLIFSALNDQDDPETGDGRVSLMRERLSAGQYAAAQRAAAKWLDGFQSRPDSDAYLSGKAEKSPDWAVEPVSPPNAPKISSTGSGFVISKDGYFLTCAHVVENARRIEVRFGNKSHRAKIISTDGQNDVALLKLDGGNFPSLPLSLGTPVMGDKVFTVGFPNPDIQGSAAKYTDGTISALSGIKDDIRTMQITVPLQGGNSGGPLADAFGAVIGLAVAQLNAVAVFEYTGTIPQNVNFAVKISYAIPLVQSVPGLADRILRPKEPLPNKNPIKAVENATGFVVVYE